MPGDVVIPCRDRKPVLSPGTMRIAHVMAGAPSGGAELFFERLVLAQARSHAVLPVIRREPGRADRLSALAPVQLPFRGTLDLVTPLRLRLTLRRFRPEVVMAWMGRAAAAAPRGDWRLVGRLGGYYDLRRFRNCDYLVANTHGLVEWVAAQGWPRERVQYLPNFTPDLSGAAPAAVGPGPVILAMGRLHRNKGFDVLIRALRDLPGATLAIAGEGPERAALEALAEAEGVAARVAWLGWRQDQAALLAAATVLAVPSRQEPLGNVVIEGFSARTPVVAAAAPGPAELIRHGDTGLLVPIEDPAALAAALASVLEDPGLAARLAASGRAEYLARHAEAAVLARWDAVLGGR